MIPVLLFDCSAALLLALFFTLFLAAPRIREKKRPAPAEKTPRPMPRAALIIPFTGRSRDVEESLHSLLRQDYPELTVYAATRGDGDPARTLALELAGLYPRLRCVECGPAELCGQKNRNLLDCLAAIDAAPADARPEIYVFCDANHRASPDFVSRLVQPLLRGESSFSTGYRCTLLLDNSLYPAAFHAINRFMRFLESLPVFTQPWGGALAADVSVFEAAGVRELWSRTVVDDSSLAGLLKKRGLRAVYCPDAVLNSPVGATSREHLDSWLFRQMLYPKFYTFRSWLLIGACLAWFGATGLAAVCLVALRPVAVACAGVFLPSELPVPALLIPGAAYGPAFFYVGALLLLQEMLRVRLARQCPRKVWFRAMLCAVRSVYVSYAETAPAREFSWRGLRYRLSTDGTVCRVDRE
ncbi:MAG: glycosyltransferase family 2 protein [Desulfovibrio sp.]|jgi:hypothetical protein|nr:glycosyltransferase family 2 protein [Desulfovibrio sp.]